MSKLLVVHITVICRECGKEFQRSNEKGQSTKVYCSKECRNRKHAREYYRNHYAVGVKK